MACCCPPPSGSAGSWRHICSRLGPTASPQSAEPFHARDVFAPAAAYLTRGVTLDAFGPALDPLRWCGLETPAPEHSPGYLDASIAFVDTWATFS